MATIAYLRVSTVGQEVEKNKMDILKLANEKKLGQVEFVEEKVSGKVSWKKRKIADILDKLKEGDTIIVSELSRLGRSMLEVMEILSIATQKGIQIYSVKGSWQLDDSIQSRLIAVCFSIAAEVERELISQRSKEGVRARIAKGLPHGRPKGPGKSKLDENKELIHELLKNQSKKTFIAKQFKTSRGNLDNWIKNNPIS
jgi:DNA invertase Pin-like site-specific DNA recombinase